MKGEKGGCTHIVHGRSRGGGYQRDQTTRQKLKHGKKIQKNGSKRDKTKIQQKREKKSDTDLVCWYNSIRETLQIIVSHMII